MGNNKKCENCIHNEVCYITELYGKLEEDEDCREYKDKSLCVELPCKVGDLVYTTDDKPNEVTECEITSFTVDYDGISGFSYEPLDKLKAGFASCSGSMSLWGETVFTDKEEAERKLREVGE